MEKNGLFDSDEEEEKIEYKPEVEAPDQNLGETVEVHPASRETQLLTESDVSPVPKNDLGDDAIEG